MCGKKHYLGVLIELGSKMLALGHRALHLALVELLLGVLDVAPDALNLAGERCALHGQVPQLLLVALSVQQARLQVPAQVPGQAWGLC